MRKGGLEPDVRPRKASVSRIATVKDRRRRSRIVPDRHNLEGAGELPRSTEPPLPFSAEVTKRRFAVGQERDTMGCWKMRGRGLEPVCGHVAPQEIAEVVGTNGRLRAAIVPQRDNSQDTAERSIYWHLVA